MSKAIQALISDWLQQRLSSQQWTWLQEQLGAIAQSNSDKELYVTLGMAPRKLGKASEAIVYYRAMDLFPDSSTYEDLIGEGLRTNMRAVFEAIAHNNPYPRKHFNDHRWNHMILKALFIDSKLYPINGIDERANADLAELLCNYAHERWAAHRPVTPELWRCVGRFATPDMLNDLKRASQSSNTNEHLGAMLAISQCPLPEAATLLATYPETAKTIANGELSWDSLTLKLNATELQPGD